MGLWSSDCPDGCGMHVCEIHSTLACALVGKTPPTAYAGDARENLRPRSQSLGGCFAAVDHSGYPARVVLLLCPRLWRLHEYRQHCGGREQARLAELLWVRLSLQSVLLEGVCVCRQFLFSLHQDQGWLRFSSWMCK